MKLPECSVHLVGSPYDVYDYDCEAIHGHDCDDCLCCYHKYGGLYNPETGKRTNKFLAFLLYGPINRKVKNNKLYGPFSREV